MLGPLMRRPRLPGSKCGGYFAPFSVAERFRAQTNRAVLTRLLRLIDSKQQIQHYLDQFSPSQTESLAVVALGPNALSPRGCASSKLVEELADSLAFLRHVGLMPIIVHGELGLSPNQDDSHPSTLDESVLQSGRLQCIRATNSLLSALLEQRDAETRPICSGVFEAVGKSAWEESPHLCNVVGITPRVIESAIRANCIPVVAALGSSSASSSTNVLDPHHAALHLARVLRPSRSIFLDFESDSLASLPSPTESTTLESFADELSPDASIMLGTAGDLSSAIFADPTYWKVLRNSQHVHVATSVHQFPSKSALRAALQRHLHPGIGISSDAILAQLEMRDFAAYFDHDPTSSSPAETIHNLALIFPRAEFPWGYSSSLSRGPSEAWNSPPIPAMSVTESHVGTGASELVLFGISKSDRNNGIADQFWSRICADHPSLWGSLSEHDPSLSWWLSQTSGFLKRQSEGKVVLWHGIID